MLNWVTACLQVCSRQVLEGLVFMAAGGHSRWALGIGPHVPRVNLHIKLQLTVYFYAIPKNIRRMQRPQRRRRKRPWQKGEKGFLSF